MCICVYIYICYYYYYSSSSSFSPTLLLLIIYFIYMFIFLKKSILMDALHEKIFIQSLLPIYHSHDTYLESILNVYANSHVPLKDYGVSERLQDMPVEMLESACEILKLIDG